MGGPHWCQQWGSRRELRVALSGDVWCFGRDGMGPIRRRREWHLIYFLLHNLKLGKLPWYLAFVNHQDAGGRHKNLTVSKKTNSVNSGIPRHSKVDYEWRSLPTHPTLGYEEIIILYSFSKRVFQGIWSQWCQQRGTVGKSHLCLRKFGKYVVKWV